MHIHFGIILGYLDLGGINVFMFNENTMLQCIIRLHFLYVKCYVILFILIYGVKYDLGIP